MMPDYGLIHTAQDVSDGADVHGVAQELNSYMLAIQGLNTCKSQKDRAVLNGIRQRAEMNLRIFVTRKMLAAVADHAMPRC